MRVGLRLTLALRLRQEPWNFSRGFSRGKNGHRTESPEGALEQAPEYGLTASPASLRSRRVRDETATVRCAIQHPWMISRARGSFGFVGLPTVSLRFTVGYYPAPPTGGRRRLAASIGSVPASKAALSLRYNTARRLDAPAA